MQSPAEENPDSDVLEPVGFGQQGFVYGTEDWVVKVRRLSLLGGLARLITRRKWTFEVRESLGGLVAPLVLLENLEFDAPKMTGRGKVVTFRRNWGVARERYPEETFLDHQLSLAEPRRALALVEEMVSLLERLRSRGFYMHDFIMRNFVEVDGRLLIADVGLIVPMRSFWELGMRTCAWGFWRGLSKDYQRLLGELLEEVGDDDALREEITGFRDSLPGRLKRLRQRSANFESAAPVAVEFDPELEKEIRATLGSVR